ncbi:hypothetical protein [Pseudoxanthomonas sp. UTMC 1351]|uniref:hypothetical protein n=1 Tax=Pseudoxanthomonas sp. UTMC 1351 TaxID=2695853 RepID=UPI0034CF82BE
MALDLQSAAGDPPIWSSLPLLAGSHSDNPRVQKDRALSHITIVQNAQTYPTIETPRNRSGVAAPGARIKRHPMSITVALTLAAMSHAAFAAGVPAGAGQGVAATKVAEEIDCDATPRHASCKRVDEKPEFAKQSGTNRVWWLAGIGLAGAALAGGGGGGGSDSGGGGGGDGGGGGNPINPNPGTEGGNYGNGGVLVAAGQQAHWQQNTNTQVTGDNARNDGQLSIDAGTLTIHRDGDLRNNGTLAIGRAATLAIQNDGELENRGTLTLNGRLNMSGDGSLDNYHTMTADGATISLSGESDIENNGTMRLRGSTVSLSGDSDFDNSTGRGARGQLHLDGTTFVLREMAEFENHGDVEAINLRSGASLFDISTQRIAGKNERIEAFDNYGSIRMDSDARVLTLVADSHDSVGINRVGGHISSNAHGQAMVHAQGQRATFVNQGTLTVTGDNAIAMSGRNGATLINEGTINLGTAGGANGTGLVAMQSDGSATLNNRVGAVINIHADNSHAFKVTGTGNGRIINNGLVNVYGSGSGVYADAGSAAAERPGPDVPYQISRPDYRVSGYTVGTNADGSAGRMVLSGGGQLVDVDVDTGFTRGTADSVVHLDDVFVGATGGEDNIRSHTVVWSAQAQRDDSGNVDITMSRNDYADLVASDLSGFAQGLDQAYTNSAIFHSLELGSVGDLEQAVSQLSGQALAVGTQRALAGGQAFWTAMDAQRPANGLSVVAYAPGLRQGWGPQGQGSAMSLVTPLRNGLGATDIQMGVLHASNEGSLHASGDSLRSNYFGAGWTRQLGSFEWRQGVSSEWHTLESTRNLAYGNVRQRARSERDVSRSAFSSTLSRGWNLGALQLSPRLMASAYRQSEGSFNETGSGEFNLSAGAVTAQGLNMETGMGWRWSVAPGLQLAGDFALVKPLAYSASVRTGSLEGIDQFDFQLPGMRPDGLDHRMQLGLDYRRGAAHMNLGLQSHRVFGESDKRMEMSLAYPF